MDPPSNNPTTHGTCGSAYGGFLGIGGHPFASLPVDQDCNGIADGWEGQYTTPPGGHLLPTADEEPGYAPTSPKGDGWSVHDEYRGFHYVADNGVTDHWTSTDPVNKFDIFFWDAGFKHRGKSQNPADDPNIYTKALRTILCLQGQAEDMGTTFEAPRALGVPTNPPPVPLESMQGAPYCYGNARILPALPEKGVSPYLSEPPIGVNELSPAKRNQLRFWYRRVKADQAGARDETDPRLGVNWFNKNSVTSTSTLGDHTIVIYYSEQSSHGILGATTNNLANCPDCDNPHRYRIAFDYSWITHSAQTYANRGVTTMSPGTLLAQVLAHETGHWLQQNHSQRQACCTFATGGKPSSLDWYRFTLDRTSGNILVGQEEYRNGSRQNLPTDSVACGLSTKGPLPTPKTTLTSLTPPMPVYDRGSPTSYNPEVTPVSTLTVQNMQYELMDWTPNYTIADPTQWHFDPANLNALCAKNPCPAQSSGKNLWKPN
ncbi:MAG: hypothetical protein LAP87_01220 [Acidobacteriia bacterium]|nr:hypothetical protein [Terriglobia bacterium]